MNKSVQGHRSGSWSCLPPVHQNSWNNRNSLMKDEDENYDCFLFWLQHNIGEIIFRIACTVFYPMLHYMKCDIFYFKVKTIQTGDISTYEICEISTLQLGARYFDNYDGFILVGKRLLLIANAFKLWTSEDFWQPIISSYIIWHQRSCEFIWNCTACEIIHDRTAR